MKIRLLIGVRKDHWNILFVLVIVLVLVLSEAVLVIQGTVKNRVNPSIVEYEYRRKRLSTSTGSFPKFQNLAR